MRLINTQKNGTRRDIKLIIYILSAGHFPFVFWTFQELNKHREKHCIARVYILLYNKYDIIVYRIISGMGKKPKPKWRKNTSPLEKH